ncbi:hypothetical protein HHL19_02830 [Streptomyces sp. R302]|uniref:hypothetical protein n=1 Tax=unclassified Streptomyces TaxID=2593676 RepID=UPI00145E4333|nr:MULTISPECIES: hypothetical protein [unclassified Streptomyces]NML49290.1 hypothetical protein [Streptomyces sp. R301]NML77617.1 hypothetical protein [Streptomyces sp. R302]
MTNLRRTAGAAAVLLAATALGATLVLLAGFVYQLAAGGAAGTMAAWAAGLLVLTVVLFGVFGAVLPDEPRTTPSEGWFDVLTFCFVLLGLIAGAPFGIAGYEALRPETTTTAPAPAPAEPR